MKTQVIGPTFYKGTWYPPAQGSNIVHQQQALSSANSRSWKDSMKKRFHCEGEEDPKLNNLDKSDDEEKKKTSKKTKKQKNKEKHQKLKQNKKEKKIENEREKTKKEANEKENEEAMESEDEGDRITAYFCVAALRHGISIKTAKQKGKKYGL